MRGRSTHRPETALVDAGKICTELIGTLNESCVSTCSSRPLELAERVRGHVEGGSGSSAGDDDGSAPSGNEKCQCHSLWVEARSPPWNRATCSAEGADVAWSCPQTSGPCHSDSAIMSRIASAIRPQPVVKKWPFRMGHVTCREVPIKLIGWMLTRRRPACEENPVEPVKFAVRLRFVGGNYRAYGQ